MLKHAVELKHKKHLSELEPLLSLLREIDEYSPPCGKTPAKKITKKLTAVNQMGPKAKQKAVNRRLRNQQSQQTGVNRRLGNQQSQQMGVNRRLGNQQSQQKGVNSAYSRKRNKRSWTQMMHRHIKRHIVPTLCQCQCKRLPVEAMTKVSQTGVYSRR